MNIHLLVIFVATQILDGWLTMKILGRGGVELNPIMAAIMDKIGDIPALALSKALAVGFLGYLCLTYPDDQTLILTMLFINVGYILVINHNWQQYEK